MTSFYWGLGIGLFLGTWFGMLIIGLCVAAKEGDD